MQLQCNMEQYDTVGSKLMNRQLSLQVKKLMTMRSRQRSRKNL